MIRFRLSLPAKADLASVLLSSANTHGEEARIRYRGLFAAAFRRIAAAPSGSSTADRSDLGPGLRSLHIRHCRNESREQPVGHAVHVIFYRAATPDLIEIVRVLHERMEPRRHLVSDQD